MPDQKQKYTIRKFEGDDQGSWAVFRKEDVKGLKGVIFAHQATPIVNGCVKREAQYYKEKFEKRE